MTAAVDTPDALCEVRVDGARLAYHQSGPPAGDPVVMLHGYPSDHRIWRHQTAALEPTHRVIALDLLGWGASDRPLDLAFDYETEVERLGRALDALELEAATIVGHDYGGHLAIGFAERHPGRVERLAILNSRSHRTFVPRWYATFSAFSLGARIPVTRTILARLPLAEINRRALAPLVRLGAIDRDLREGYVGWMNEPEGRRWLLHFFSEYRVSERPGLADRLGEIACPAAIIWGARDPYLRTAIATELAERIPGAELTLIPEAGHFTPEEAPEEVSAALEALLAR